MKMNKKKILAMSISAAITSGTVGVAMASEMVAIIFKKPTTKYIIVNELSLPDESKPSETSGPSPVLMKIYNALDYKFALDVDGNLWQEDDNDLWVKTSPQWSNRFVGKSYSRSYGERWSCLFLW